MLLVEPRFSVTAVLVGDVVSCRVLHPGVSSSPQETELPPPMHCTDKIVTRASTAPAHMTSTRKLLPSSLAYSNGAISGAILDERTS